jgi:hypothetical protein
VPTTPTTGSRPRREMSHHAIDAYTETKSVFVNLA